MTVSLIDAFTRHQVYLEGYKRGLDNRLDPMLVELYGEVQDALKRLGVDRLNELTRRQLNKLIQRIQRAQGQRSNKFRRGMLRELKDFAYADAGLNRDIMQTTEDKTTETAYGLGDGLPLLGLLALRRNTKGRARLWALVSNSPDPATGLTPPKLLGQYLSYAKRNVRDLIVRGYANGWTVQETIRELFGTRRRKFRDGLVARMATRGSAMLHTLVQHVSSVVQAGVSSVFYKYYEWVAVLDQNTTKICRMRDGIKYKYRKGPLPPAHYRCRSRAVPVRAGATYQNVPDSFYGWLKLQPALVQDDFIGVSLAGGLRSGRVNAKGLGRFRARRALTLEEFLAKFNFIIAT